MLSGRTGKQCHPDHLVGVVDVRGLAHRRPLPGRCAQVGHFPTAVEERMRGSIPAEIRGSDHLASLVDARGLAVRSPKRAQVLHLVRERLCGSLLGLGWPRPQTQQCYCSHYKSYEDGARYTSVYRCKGRICSSHLLILSGRSRGLYLAANIAFRDPIVLLPLLNLLCTFDPTPLCQCGLRSLSGTLDCTTVRASSHEGIPLTLPLFPESGA